LVDPETNGEVIFSVSLVWSSCNWTLNMFILLLALIGYKISWNSTNNL